MDEVVDVGAGAGDDGGAGKDVVSGAVADAEVDVDVGENDAWRTVVDDVGVDWGGVVDWGVDRDDDAGEDEPEDCMVDDGGGDGADTDGGDDKDVDADVGVGMAGDAVGGTGGDEGISLDDSV